MKVAVRILQWTLVGVLGFGLLVAGLTFLLLRTQPGHDFLLRTALRQSPGFVNGELSVGRLTSVGLLRGFTLHDLRIADSAGRPFVTTDSLRVRYSVSDLLRRNIVLVPVEIWNPDVVIERLHGDAGSNVARILSGRDPGRPEDSQPAPTEDPGVRVTLRGTRIHDGSLLLRIPVEGAPAARGVHERLEGEVEGQYRLLRFERVEATIAEANLVGPELDAPSLRVEDLSFVGLVLDEPFTVTELRGDFLLGEATVSLDLDRLWLPDSELSGNVVVGWGDPEGPVSIDAAVEADVFAFGDFRWIEPRLPDGGGRMTLLLSGPVDQMTWKISEADLQVGDSRLRGALGLQLGLPLRISETEVDLAPLDLDDLEPWIPEPIPFEGRLTGTVRAEGRLDALSVSGNVVVEHDDPEIESSTAEVEGIVRLVDGFGASGLSVTLDPLRYGTIQGFLPDLEIVGEGRARVVATGQLSSSVQVSGDLEHGDDDGHRSVVSISGAFQTSGDDVSLALAATLDPLSLDGLAVALGASFPVSGDAFGMVRAVGPVSDLLLSGSLTTPGGPFEASTRLDLRAPLDQYRIEASLDRFRLDRIAAGLPEPTEVSGEILVDGSGLDPEDLSGTGRLVLRDSRIGRAVVPNAEANLRAVDGRLLVDALTVSSPFVDLYGEGDLALRRDQPDGRLSITFVADSLTAVRPIVLGDEIIAADTLTQLERDILRLDGIDPDTLSGAEQLSLAGSAQGEVVLRGGVRDLEGEGFVEVTEGVFGQTSVARSRADIGGSWRGVEDWSTEGVVDFEGLGALGMSFARGNGGFRYASSGEGGFELVAEGPENGVYTTDGTIQRDSEVLTVGLQTLEVMLPQEGSWHLAEPARLRFEGTGVSTDGVRITGSSGGSSSTEASVQARGRVDPQGESDFELEVRFVELDQVERMMQSDGLPSGNIDLTLEIAGHADDPIMRGDFLIRDFGFNGTALSRVEGTIDYGQLGLETELTGQLNGRRLFSLDGRIPADLSFGEVEDRFPNETIDLTIAVDSLPASTVLAVVDALEGVEGAFDGRIRLQGTLDEVRPSGEIRLRGGALSIPDLGLTTTALTADLGVGDGFEVQVNAEARAGGRAQVTGTVSLVDITDPGFDLRLTATGFRAVDRRDLTASIGGEIQLGGQFTQPLVTGAVDVERGELFLQEFVRGAEVIDLNDPRFFDVVDTSLVAGAGRELSQNPFIQNLRVDVQLVLESDFWIRSQEQTQGMDVEIGGELGVTFDRPARELRLVGGLEAIRGSYAQFGRLFDVQSGTIEFVGTPGINPSLNIQAIHRLRRAEAEPLNVIANVGGTLLNPQVSLSSDAQPPIPESDLISYLLFGRPSYALASGETSVVESAAASLVGAGLNLGVSQLGSTFSRSLGVDYLSVSQAQQVGGLGVFRNPSGLFAETEVEMGRYVGENLFISLTLRPLTGLGPTRRTNLPGARVEWRFNQFWSIEGFLEDRFARLGSSGFGELDNDFARVFGISLFREWGY